MVHQRKRVLEALLDLYDEVGRPVTPTQLDQRVEGGHEVIREHLDALRSYELVKLAPGGTGYEPTVTGREFLELDVDDEFVVIEFPDDS